MTTTTRTGKVEIEMIVSEGVNSMNIVLMEFRLRDLF